MASSNAATWREASGLRVLTLTTLQQAGLTAVRFGLPILAPFWRDALHLSLGQVGLLMGAFDLGALLMFLPLGLLVDRFGEPAVLAGGALFTAAATAVVTRAHQFWSLALFLAVAGLGYGSGQTAGVKVVATTFGARGRGTAMGVRQSGLPLGGMIAALLLPPLVGAFGWRAGIAGAAVVCAIPGVLCWAGLRRDPADLDVEGPVPLEGGPSALRNRAGSIGDQVREILRRSGVRRTTETAVLLVVAQFCYQGYLALYLVDRFGWSKHAAATMLVAVHLGGVLGRLAWGALSDRGYGGRRVPALAWCVGAGMVFPLALIALPPVLPPLGIALVALAGGVLLLGWNGLYSTLITESAGIEQSGIAMGVSMTFLFLGAMVAPPLFGWLVDRSAYAVGWSALIVVMGFALAIVRRIPEPGDRPSG